MSGEKFNLARNEFESYASYTFKELRNDDNFIDVTLACEDGKQIKAHKAILSTSSNVFRNILVNNPHQHPLLYLKGIHSGDLEVAQEDLEQFMQTANELKNKIWMINCLMLLVKKILNTEFQINFLP